MHNAESLPTNRQPNSTTTPTCRPLTVGPSTLKTSTAFRLSHSPREWLQGLGHTRSGTLPNAQRGHGREAIPAGFRLVLSVTTTRSTLPPADPDREQRNRTRPVWTGQSHPDWGRGPWTQSGPSKKQIRPWNQEHTTATSRPSASGTVDMESSLSAESPVSMARGDPDPVPLGPGTALAAPNFGSAVLLLPWGTDSQLPTVCDVVQCSLCAYASIARLVALPHLVPGCCDYFRLVIFRLASSQNRVQWPGRLGNLRHSLARPWGILQILTQPTRSCNSQDRSFGSRLP